MTPGRDGLIELIEELKGAPEIYRPSAFGAELIDVGPHQLEQGGFKRTSSAPPK